MLRRCSLLVLSFLILGGILPLTALAMYIDNPPAQPGFTHSPKLSADDTGHGKELSGGPIGWSAPTIADVDGNSANGKEIVVGGIDGMLYVYRNNGSLAWEKRVTSQCNSSIGYPDGGIISSPSVGALFGDGVPYIVVGFGGVYSNCVGGIVAYNGATGVERWRYNFRNPSGLEQLHGIISAPALADIDGDGTLEVGFGNLERDIWMLNEDGSERWRFHNADTVFSTATFTDVDGDGLPDMIIGSDISRNDKLGTQDGGYVTAFRGTNGTVLWRQFFDQTIYSSPALVDLDDNGVPEVVVGSGCFFSTATKGHWVKILDSRNGATIRTLNANGCVSASPAIADLDGDGKLDIVAVVDGKHNSPATPGYVEAWSYDNPTPKWMTTPHESVSGADQQEFIDRRSAVIADIDGNGSLEVLMTNFNDVMVFNGANGVQLTCNKCSNSTKALFAWYPLASTPAVGDLDGDGDLEVVVGGTNYNKTSKGYLYVWTNIALGSPAGNAGAYSAPWPMFHRNARHTGIVPSLLRSPSSMTILAQAGGSPRTSSASLRDVSGGAIAWTASANKSWLTVSGQGTTPGVLTITADPSGKNAGFDDTGTISLSSASGSPTISVRMLVLDRVYETYLPSVQR